MLDMRKRVEETGDEWDEHADEWKFVYNTTPSSLGISPVEALMKTELNYDAFLRSKGVDVRVYYQTNKDKKAGLKIKWQGPYKVIKLDDQERDSYWIQKNTGHKVLRHRDDLKGHKGTGIANLCGALESFARKPYVLMVLNELDLDNELVDTLIAGWTTVLGKRWLQRSCVKFDHYYRFCSAHDVDRTVRPTNELIERFKVYHSGVYEITPIQLRRLGVSIRVCYDLLYEEGYRTKLLSGWRHNNTAVNRT
eukprot:Awhi_evm2s1521